MQPYEILESEYAKYVGTDFAVSANTGTSALHLALKALGVGPGDEVIVPEYTMIACAWAVTYCGAKPVFVDCKDDLTIDESKIEHRITTATKAIMPVHIYGRVCNMDKIMSIAQRYNLRVLEDCAEAQGAMYGDKQVGSFDVGICSFYQNKIIPAEEGGMITTNDPAIAAKAKFLKNMSFTEKHDYIHPEIGFNYRMSNLQASMALAGLQMVNGIQLKRKQIESWYNEFIPKKLQMPPREVVWVYDLKHPKKDKLVEMFNKDGINARHGFRPMSEQPMYRGRHTHLNAYKLGKKVFYLPVTPIMSKGLVRKICQKLDEYISVL